MRLHCAPSLCAYIVHLHSMPTLCTYIVCLHCAPRYVCITTSKVFKNVTSVSFQVADSMLIRYLPMKSAEEEGLESAILGLAFEASDLHFVATVHPDKRELWVRCEATMPPIEGMTYPFTREVFLGSFARSFDRYQAASSEASSSGRHLEKCKSLFNLLLCGRGFPYD